MSSHPSGINPAEFPEPFASQYRTHLQHLQLKGLRPKTIEAYARAMRRIGAHFNFEVSALSPAHPDPTDPSTAAPNPIASSSGLSNKRIRSRLRAIYPYSLGSICAALHKCPAFVVSPATSDLEVCR